MYVSVYICINMMYILVLYLYMLVFPEMTRSDTGTDATSPTHSLSKRILVGHTQVTSGHLSIHFFSPSANVVQTRFGASYPEARVQGP